jgi:hypothetical protein
MTVIGLDLGHTTTREAEHWLANLPPVPGLMACTHFVGGRVVITVDGIDTNELPPHGVSSRTGEASAAASEHSTRRSGRVVIYPGVARLVGSLPVADMVAMSAIERVVVMGLPGRPEAEPRTIIDTRDFVRPQWMDGALTLVATPAPSGRIAPFEVPNPTPCCADHA